MNPHALSLTAALLFFSAFTFSAAADSPKRPPPLPEQPTASTPWQHHADVGASFAFISRFASHTLDGSPSPTRFEPAPGVAVHIDWRLFSDYLRFNAYLHSARHNLDLPPGALGLTGAHITEPQDFASYSFGARLCPTLPLTAYISPFVCGGIGWGRLEFGRMSVQPANNAPLVAVRERSASFGEIPIGLGTHITLIPRWLALRLEISAAFPFGQEGTATHDTQIIDGSGQILHIPALPLLDASFTQTIGLSLLL